MKMIDIHSADFKIVEKKKIWFCIPLALLVVTLICGIIYGFVYNGNVLNLGMEFTGGYSLTVTLGGALDDDATREADEQKLTDIIEHADTYGLTYNEVPVTGLKVMDITKQGEGENEALRVSFTSSYTQTEMGDTTTEGTIIYELVSILDENFFADDPYGGSVTDGGSVSASVSSELLITAVCGVIMALALMLIYIAIRFELLSGIIALICLVHDIAIMFMFMLVFHIPVTSTFIAALITILGYSINNTIIIFDKVRDNVKTMPAGVSANQLADVSVRDTMVRSINTTATTFIMVFMVWLLSAIFGVGDLVNFCWPLMAGLIAGAFSSVCLAPSLWAMWKTRSEKKAKAKPAEAITVAAPEEKKDELFGDINFDEPSDSAETAKSEESAEEVGKEDETPPDNKDTV